MIDAGVLPGFIAMILLFLAPPGPDMAYMLAVGLEGGRRAASRAILGIGTGMAVYAAAVALGVGRLVQAFPMVLDAVKILGALYLLWLAYGTLRHAREAKNGSGKVAVDHWYLRGVSVSLANPKLILFFVAVLPQFLGSARSPGMQMAMLGAVNVAAEVLLYGGIGVLAGQFHARMGGQGRAGVVLTYVAGTVYLVLAGVFLAEVWL